MAGIRERIVGTIKDAPGKEIRDLLRDILVVLDKPYDIAWMRDEYKLSPTEFKVLQLMVEGKQAAAISEAIGTQISTTRVHMSKIYRKTNVNNATELAALMLTRARNI